MKGTPTASQSLNRYAYCQGNPVNQLDPFGLCPVNIEMIMAVMHLTLALLGCVPVYGAAFDIINASLFFAEGDTMSGLLCLASAAIDVGNYATVTGELLNICRLAKAGTMIRTAGIAYTTGTMAYLTGENMANTITLYIDNDYQITDEVAESAGLTVMSGLGTVMGYRALDSSIQQMQAVEAMGTYCFAAGTQVLTEAGLKNIEDIQPRDKVYSTSEETGESDYKEVLQVFVKETEVITHVFYEVQEENGETRTEEIETTLNHLFWCEGEWKVAGTLKPGDKLTLANGTQVEVENVTYEDRHTTVYNMEVADYHTYYVGEDGVWVHNTGKNCGITSSVGTGTGESGRRPDFYVTPSGDVVPSTGYRYMSSTNASDALNTGRQYTTYFGFKKFNSASQAQDAFQISPNWSDCKVRGTFDTLQVIDDMYVPTTLGNTTTIPEPFTVSYPQYGKGGVQQFRVDKIIEFLEVKTIGN